jgi:hypothetical protein
MSLTGREDITWSIGKGRESLDATAQKRGISFSEARAGRGWPGLVHTSLGRAHSPRARIALT